MWISACRQKQPTLRQLLGQDEVNSCVATRSSDLEAFEIFEVTRKPPTSADSSLLCGESRTCRLRPSVLISYRNAQKILLYCNAFANVLGDARSGAKLAAQRVREITRACNSYSEWTIFRRVAILGSHEGLLGDKQILLNCVESMEWLGNTETLCCWTELCQ